RRGVRGRMLEPEVKSLARFAFVSVQRMARKLAAELRLPEGAPRRRRQSRLDPGAQFAGEPRECCEAMWQHRLEPLPQAAGEHGRGAAGRNRDDEWRTIDDRGDDEAAGLRVIDAVDEDATPLTLGADPAIDFAIVRRRDREQLPGQEFRPELARNVGDPVF